MSREEPAGAPLHECARSVSVVWRGGRGADHVDPELGGASRELGGGHAEDRPVKAIRIHEDGGPEVLRYEDVPDPEPGQGEVLIRLAAASLNHLDVWVRQGPPVGARSRASSEPTARASWRRSGEGVDGLAVGDRVVINPGLEHGDMIAVVGEHCRRDALRADRRSRREQVFSLDDALSFEEAAAFPLVYETAYRMLVTKASVAGGRVGADLGHRRRRRDRGLRDLRVRSALRTIVTSGSDEKLEQARAWGADVAVNHHDGDVVGAQ